MLGQVLHEYWMDHKATLTQGLVSILGVSISFLESIEIYVRLIGASVGIAVGILTIYRLVLDIKTKKKAMKMLEEDDNTRDSE